jgi:hypothetical protein
VLFAQRAELIVGQYPDREGSFILRHLSG